MNIYQEQIEKLKQNDVFNTFGVGVMKEAMGAVNNLKTYIMPRPRLSIVSPHASKKTIFSKESSNQVNFRLFENI